MEGQTGVCGVNLVNIIVCLLGVYIKIFQKKLVISYVG